VLPCEVEACWATGCDGLRGHQAFDGWPVEGELLAVTADHQVSFVVLLLPSKIASNMSASITATVAWAARQVQVLAGR